MEINETKFQLLTSDVSETLSLVEALESKMRKSGERSNLVDYQFGVVSAICDRLEALHDNMAALLADEPEA